MTESTTPEFGSVFVEFTRHSTVATILIDRAAKLNALTLSMLDALRQTCVELATSDARVVIVRTAGDRVFSVGADINHFAELDAVEMWRQWISTGHAAFSALANLPQPTIAVVDGLAYGGGLELALAADFRVLSETAQVALPEAGLGTVPGWGGTERLAALIGEHRTKEMILTRRVLTAAEALDWGIATRIAGADGLDASTDELLEQLLGSAPIASQVAKQIIRATVDGASSATLEALAAGVTASTSDLAEGIAAFRQKRPPRFTNR
jgi:enoyl-CoA hydratase